MSAKRPEQGVSQRWDFKGTVALERWFGGGASKYNFGSRLSPAVIPVGQSAPCAHFRQFLAVLKQAIRFSAGTLPFTLCTWLNT